MGVDDVEAVVGDVEVVDVADRRGDVVDAPLGRHGHGLVEDRALPFQGHDLTGSHDGRQVRSDGSRSAADVEEALAGREMGEEIGRRVLRRPRPVGRQNGLVVTMGVTLASHGHETTVGHPPVDRSLRW